MFEREKNTEKGSGERETPRTKPSRSGILLWDGALGADWGGTKTANLRRRKIGAEAPSGDVTEKEGAIREKEIILSRGVLKASFILGGYNCSERGRSEYVGSAGDNSNIQR